MKKYIYSIIATIFCIMNTYAQKISVENVTIKPGEKKVVSINLINTQNNIVSFQMDLILPEGIIINKAECSMGNRITDKDQELVIGKQPDGSIRFTSTSLALNPITGTSGEIIKLSLTAANDAKGDIALLKNIILATSNSSIIRPNNASFKVDVLYTLAYKVDGELYKTSTVAYGTAILPEEILTMEGYTFSGWSEIPKTMPAKDVVVTGSFTVNKYKLTYLVDRIEYKSYEINYASAITPESFPTKEGYTFSGWSEIPATMPAKDVVVTGTFTVNNYTLTYKVDGEVYKTIPIVYGTTLTPETAPTKEGYTFSGWSELPTTMPAQDVVITGSFTINTYTLTYKIDDEVYKTTPIAYGTTLILEVAPTKEGHTFTGWSGIPATMPAKDVVVTGSFSVNSYILTYEVNGEVYKTVSVLYGTKLTAEAAPTKEGHSFSGWSEMPETMPANDVAVTGSFSINSYTLTYMVDGEVYKTISVAYGTALTPEVVPTNEGYTFCGWSEIPETMPAKDVVVIGTYTANSYTLIYKVDGEVYKTIPIAYGTALTPEVAPTKEGYTFSGWSEIPATMPAKDIVVTGTFFVNSYTLTYKVDGEVYETTPIVYGTVLTPKEEPTKEGYTFSGWSEIPKTMPAHDIVVNGTFSVNSYFLFYILDGGIYKALSIKYGTMIVPEEAPIKEGYTFSGWSELPDTMPSHDVTIQGQLIINSYTITYNVDGEMYKTKSFIYGTPLNPEAEPIKEGYTFSGWSEIPATMPAKDIIVTGTFTINSYTLTYMIDGKIYKTYPITYGTSLTHEADPIRIGYTFNGWSKIPDTMPARDVIVTGSFIAKLATGVVLDKGNLLFNNINPQKLNVTLTPADLINKAVTWSSTNPDIAIVNNDGIVTPVNNGEAFIIVSTTDGTDMKDSCKVTVDFKAATLSIDKKETALTELKSQKLTAIVIPEKASQEVTWSSNDANIVTVDEYGNITPKRNGEATITATTTDGTQLKATCKVIVDIPSLFEAMVTQTTLIVSTKSGMAEAKNVKLTVEGEEYDAAMITGLAPNQTYRVKATADIGGYNWTEEFEVTTMNIAVNFSCNASPTTLDISSSYNAGDATVTYASFSSETEVNTLNITGLEPDQEYEYTYYITTKEGGNATYKAHFSTEALELKILQTKVVQIGDVVIVASSNIVEEDNVTVGFERRRYDWPNEIENRSGVAYIYEGTIEGSIKNLNAEKFWKIRPFFQSQAGNRYWGDWVTIDPSDASYFEPSVHTYNTISVEDNTAELKGFVMEGTDNVEKQGFMYWKNVPFSTRRYAKSIPDNAMVIEVKGNKMVAMLNDLDYDTEYSYVAFATTADNETFYGEEQMFKTGEASQDVIDGINNIEHETSHIALSGTWYDLNGSRIPAPQKGVNIIRMSDGIVKKVLIK